MKGGRNRGRETSVCGCLSHAPYWGPDPKPRHAPWLGIEPVTVWFSGTCSIHWATPARVISDFYPQEFQPSAWMWEKKMPISTSKGFLGPGLGRLLVPWLKEWGEKGSGQEEEPAGFSKTPRGSCWKWRECSNLLVISYLPRAEVMRESHHTLFYGKMGSKQACICNIHSSSVQRF